MTPIIEIDEIHFAHTADWHLGRRPYHIDKLYEDFFRSANRCIDNIISRNPDFVIHCGDLFNEANPDSGVRIEAHRLLRKLKKAKIPLYVIRGNHDASAAYSERAYGTILDELDGLGFINYVKDTVVKINDFTYLYGVGEYGKGIGTKLKDLLDKYPIDKSKINILAMHAYVKGQLPAGKGHITPYQLSELHFDYIAVGHFHTPWQDQETRIFCPGSIEHHSISEWKSPDDKGFCTERGFLDVIINRKKDLKVSRISHNVRPKAKLTINLKSKTAKDAETEIEKVVRENDRKGGLLHITIKGKLDAGELAKINFRKLQTIKQNLLHCTIVADISENKIIEKMGVTEEDVVYNLLISKHGFSEEKAKKFQSIAKEISTILSRKTKVTDDLEDQALELLDKYIVSDNKEE